MQAFWFFQYLDVDWVVDMAACLLDYHLLPMYLALMRFMIWEKAHDLSDDWQLDPIIFFTSFSLYIRFQSFLGVVIQNLNEIWQEISFFFSICYFLLEKFSFKLSLPLNALTTSHFWIGITLISNYFSQYRTRS